MATRSRQLNGASAKNFIKTNMQDFDVDLLEQLFDLRNMGPILAPQKTRDYLQSIKPKRISVKKQDKPMANDVKPTKKESASKNSSALSRMKNVIKQEEPMFGREMQYVVKASPQLNDVESMFYIDLTQDSDYKTISQKAAKMGQTMEKSKKRKIEEKQNSDKEIQSLTKAITSRNRHYRKQPLQMMKPKIDVESAIEMFIINHEN